MRKISVDAMPDPFFSIATFRRGKNCFFTLFAYIGCLATFTSLDFFSGDSYSIFEKIIYPLFLLLGIFFVVVTFSFFQHKHNVENTDKITISSLGNRNKLNIIFGDIWEKSIINSESRTNIVISFNRCFDTKVDDALISLSYLHGELVKRLISSGKYDENTLNAAIESSLSRFKNEKATYELIQNKKSGYKKRYPVGTVADVTGVNNEHYFCLGLSKFNQLTAELDKKEYISAISSLVEQIIELSQGYPVYLPLIGTGRANIGIDNKMALDTIIHIILLYRATINCDINIVLKKELKNIVEIQ